MYISISTSNHEYQDSFAAYQHCAVANRDAPIRHWPIIGRPIIGA